MSKSSSEARGQGKTTKSASVMSVANLFVVTEVNTLTFETEADANAYAESVKKDNEKAD